MAPRLAGSNTTAGSRNGWRRAGRPSYGVPEHVVSVVELVVAYLDYAKAYYGPGNRGECANMRHALRPLRELYGRLPAREFGPLHLKAIREKYLALGHSRKHINASVQRIGRVFRWGVSEGMIPPDVPQALAMVPGLRRGHTAARENKRVKPADTKLVDATLPYLPPIVRSMVELQQMTGMRPGELCIMRPADIDRTADVWQYQPTQHKNQNREQERIVYIGPRAQEILRPYLLRDSEAFCFSPADSEAKRRAELHLARKTPLSCGNRPGSKVPRTKRQVGERYTPQSYLVAVRRASDKAFPVPDDLADDPEAVAKWEREHRWSPNQLRHAMATARAPRSGYRGGENAAWTFAAKHHRHLCRAGPATSNRSSEDDRIEFIYCSGRGVIYRTRLAGRCGNIIATAPADRPG